MLLWLVRDGTSFFSLHWLCCCSIYRIMAGDDMGRDHAALRVPAYRASTFSQTMVLDFSLLSNGFRRAAFWSFGDPPLSTFWEMVSGGHLVAKASKHAIIIYRNMKSL